MNEVTLKGLEFKAYHGYYEEEKERGNRFVVDISVTAARFEEAAQSDDLQLAVNYEELYAIVKDEMQIASVLLENVVYRIANRVIEEIAQVETVKVSLAKLNPPIRGMCEEARVTLEKRRN